MHLMGLVIGDKVEVMLADILDDPPSLLHGSYRLRHALLLLRALGCCENHRFTVSALAIQLKLFRKYRKNSCGSRLYDKAHSALGGRGAGAKGCIYLG